MMLGLPYSQSVENAHPQFANLIFIQRLTWHLLGLAFFVIENQCSLHFLQSLQ